MLQKSGVRTFAIFPHTAENIASINEPSNDFTGVKQKSIRSPPCVRTLVGSVGLNCQRVNLVIMSYFRCKLICQRNLDLLS